MKNRVLLTIGSLLLLSSCAQVTTERPTEVRLTKNELADKIRGGWAGQTIGVVFGAPTEFKFTGTTIQSYQPLMWSDTYVKYWWDKKPGLFDDIYNDITFVQTFEEEGVDCSQQTLAEKFAWAEYHLAHANQAGRYNVRNGINPPESGYWMNNPHADDLDFQIEADFIGLMAPALMPEAMEVADKVGHIMNSGDGFYGGAFVAGLYSAAFATQSTTEILDMALSTIPTESQFYQCIDDVRTWHAKYPNDWEQCWFEVHKKWNRDVGCPKGTLLSFNIDAKINAAYIAIGLLYGEGDFTKTLEISTRCGQDSDCNPATLGGVLGVMNGYDAIPEFWRVPLSQIEDLNFDGTTVSLKKANEMSYNQALLMIERAGGSTEGDSVVIPQRQAEVIPLEQNFQGMHPYFRDRKDCYLDKEYTFTFNGNGYAIWGNLCPLKEVSKNIINRVSMRHIGSEVFGLAELNDPYVAIVEVWIDGKLDHTARMPMKNTDRRVEPSWRYMLDEGEHTVKMVWTNPNKNYTIRLNDIIYYTANKPTESIIQYKF